MKKEKYEIRTLISMVLSCWKKIKANKSLKSIECKEKGIFNLLCGESHKDYMNLAEELFLVIENKDYDEAIRNKARSEFNRLEKNYSSLTRVNNNSELTENINLEKLVVSSILFNLSNLKNEYLEISNSLRKAFGKKTDFEEMFEFNNDLYKEALLNDLNGFPLWLREEISSIDNQLAYLNEKWEFIIT